LGHRISGEAAASTVQPAWGFEESTVRLAHVAAEVIWQMAKMVNRIFINLALAQNN
jgi:hypothetical protein